MSEVTDIIKKVVSKQLTPEAAVPALQKVLVTSDPTRESGDLSFEQKEKRAMADDNDYTNTFSEIVAAWVGGQLSDEQFGAIREGILGGINQSKPSPNGPEGSAPPVPGNTPPPQKPV